MTEPTAPTPPFLEPPQPPSNRRIQLLAGLVFIALLAVVVIVLLSGRTDPRDSAVVKSGDPSAASKLLDGLEQHGTTLGDPKAPVTIVEIIDLQCPFCRAYTVGQQPTVVRTLVRSGKAKITIVPLAFLGPDSGVGRNVFLRLAAKDHGWDFLERAFVAQGPENSGYMTSAWLATVTKGIPGVTSTDLQRGRTPAILPQINEAEALGDALMKKGDGTPFVAVGPSSAEQKTYKKVDLTAGSDAADSVIAAVRAVH